MMDHDYFMSQAIKLAEQGRGLTAPNPCVGALLVQDQTIVAQGWHQAYGQPHAEIEALAQARQKHIDPRSCQMYVTLEPCNHQGQTGPCTQAILKAGVPEVFVGCLDPNPMAQGGADYLRSHGLKVQVGILEHECQDLIADFLVWTKEKRPFVLVKLATTLDGKIATRTGHSAWISNKKSRQAVHELRSWVQGVMVGGGTFRADNPQLTCRLENFSGPQPWAVVVTTVLPDAGTDFTLLATRPEQVIFLTSEAQSQADPALALRAQGAAVWGLPSLEGGLDLEVGLQRLFQEHGCYYLLVEGGGQLSASLMTQGLLDELRLFQAMKILGDAQGAASFSGRQVLTMDQSWPLRLVEHYFLDTDLYLRLRP